MPPDRHETQPSAEIVRVGCAKCRRECDLSRSRATLCGDRACRMREMQARVRFVTVRSNDRACWMREMQARLRFVPVAGNPGEIARVERTKCRRECDWSRSRAMHAGIERVECAKCKRECDLSRSGTTLHARVRFDPVRGNPLRRSFVSRARNAGESAICVCPAQPSAEIVRVECANCRRRCDLTRSMDNPLRRSCVSLHRHWCDVFSRSTLCGVSGELEDENWRLFGTTLIRGAICGAGS